jgi:hypothetical protein
VKARADSWPTRPLPPERERVQIERRFSAEEYARLGEGHVPAGMDDKWFAYLGDDGVLRFHRSWTGDCLYTVAFAPDADGYVVTEAWANRSPKQGLTSPEHDPEALGQLLDSLAGRPGD